MELIAIWLLCTLAFGLPAMVIYGLIKKTVRLYKSKREKKNRRRIVFAKTLYIDKTLYENSKQLFIN